MIKRSQLKALSKTQIKNKIGDIFLVGLASYAIEFGVFLVVGIIIPFFSWPFLMILTAPFTLAWANIWLSIVSLDKAPVISDIFADFKGENFTKSILAYFRVYFFTMLWLLLFLVPGIVKSISYSFTYFILKDRPELTAKQAQAESIRLTKGRKWQLFVLGLSYIPWILLVTVTFGLAIIWVAPYINTGYANAYLTIRDADYGVSTQTESNPINNPFDPISNPNL